MSLQVIARPVKQANSALSSTLCLLSHDGATARHHVQNGVLCLGHLEKTTKEPKLPNSDTPLLPWRQPSGNRLKWLQGHLCRALQTCFPMPAKSLQYLLTCRDVEGAHLLMSEHWGLCVLSVLILLQLAITQRLGRNNSNLFFETNFFCDFSHRRAPALIIAIHAVVQVLDVADCLSHWLLPPACHIPQQNLLTSAGFLGWDTGCFCEAVD